jgi:hypothetical protein
VAGALTARYTLCFWYSQNVIDNRDCSARHDFASPDLRIWNRMRTETHHVKAKLNKVSWRVQVYVGLKQSRETALFS